MEERVRSLHTYRQSMVSTNQTNHRIANASANGRVSKTINASEQPDAAKVRGHSRWLSQRSCLVPASLWLHCIAQLLDAITGPRLQRIYVTQAIHRISNAMVFTSRLTKFDLEVTIKSQRVIKINVSMTI